MNAHLLLQENTKGIDWVVGDIHGEYDKLFKKLNDVQFNFDNDRLICSGDLCDRGPNSYGVVDLLNDGWLYSTRGNHEDMCINAYMYDWAMGDFVNNGGMWFYDLFPCEQDRVIELMMGLPLTIRFPVGDKRYMVIHARVPNDDVWDSNMKPDRLMKDIPVNYLLSAVWNRFSDPTPPRNIDGYNLVFCGHTPHDKPTRISDYLNMDTGVVFDENKDFVFYNTKSEEIV